MSSGKWRDFLKLILIGAWLAFTVAFALWWSHFSLDHISELARLEPDKVIHWESQRRMLKWEGLSWIVLLILGGGALVALVERERWRVRRIREFFASFSHEIKTSLASLRIQAEALQADTSVPQNPILDRLVADTVRLQVQLENSLFLASQNALQLVIEPLSLRELMERMREQWPDLQIELVGDCQIQADERAIRTVFSNLFQNAIVHGQASKIQIQAAAGGGRVRLKIADNGRGFDGAFDKLGRLFHRPKATSGSGLGLYICRLLIRKMNGELELVQGTSGFQIEVVLSGGPA